MTAQETPMHRLIGTSYMVEKWRRVLALQGFDGCPMVWPKGSVRPSNR